MRRATRWCASTGEGTPKGLRLDEATVKSVLSERAPAISNLVAFDDGRVLVTFIAVPVLRKEALNGIVYVGVEHRGWLDFLNHYPIAKRATLTLNDRNGAIITRTLNDEQWAGKRSSSGYWDRTIGKAEGVFQSVGLEGQRFYSAFSRSEQAGWVLGTGVPRDDVEAGLSVPTTLLGLGIATAIVLASLLALFLGRRVADTVTALANYAKSMAKPNRPTPSAPLPIVEAETMRMALDEAAVQLDARERSVNEALEREARSRAAAEHANQAKDQFLAMLGHELRNPLSAISAAITVLDMTTRDHDAQTAGTRDRAASATSSDRDRQRPAGRVAAHDRQGRVEPASARSRASSCSTWWRAFAIRGVASTCRSRPC